ncbi:hypothetical protein LP7551_01432 [Roseibium album]|nr:hypothetical protein LP7551_01432 [Roseibium album]
MRHHRKVAFVFTILFSLVNTLPGLATEAQDKVYRIGYIIGSIGHATAIKRLAQVYMHAGLMVEFVPLPAQRSIVWSDSGELDGDAARVPAIEKNHLNLVRVGEPVNTLRGFAYSTNPALAKTFGGSVKELAGLEVGYVTGVRWAKGFLSGRSAVEVATYPDLMRMLARGRIDVAIATESSADEILAKDYPATTNMIKLAPVLYQTGTYHYLNVRNRDIVSLLEISIRELSSKENTNW